MTKEEHHVAMPRLYGAPPTRRPAPAAKEAPRPFDPDDLPVTADLSDDELSFVDSLPPEAFLPGGGLILGADGQPVAAEDGRRRWFSLRGLRRLFGSS
ncbi:MAG TPA: hypothetical protein VH723_07835 [Candidatus Limnocylindrales bacterium]